MSKYCLSSALRCYLFKERKETGKRIICYYSSLRMQRTKGTLRFKNPCPRPQIHPSLINCYFGPDMSRMASRKVERSA